MSAPGRVGYAGQDAADLDVDLVGAPLVDRAPQRVRQWTGPADRAAGGRGRAAEWAAARLGDLLRACSAPSRRCATVVEFLADTRWPSSASRSSAALGDTDRVQVADHPLARLLRQPNPGTTRYTVRSPS